MNVERSGLTGLASSASAATAEEVVVPFPAATTDRPSSPMQITHSSSARQLLSSWAD